MSNIPAARRWLESALHPKTTKAKKDMCMRFALHHMTRAKAVARARKKSVKITQYMRRMVKVYASQGKPQTWIARKVGLPNPGRVSEILHGKR